MSELYKPVVATGNDVIDSLLLDGGWNTTSLTYGFKEQDIDGNGVSDFDEGDWKAFYAEIYSNVSSFCNLDFVESDVESANLRQRLDPGAGGESGTPVVGVTSLESAVGINPDSVKAAADVVRLGTFSETWIHEIGHSLGLGHPHDGVVVKLPGVVEPGDFGTGNINSQLYTIMSYTGSFWGEDNPFTSEHDENTALNAQSGSFGAIDIAALQHLYGARAYNTGNDVYRFSDNIDTNLGYTTIWDTGGSDTIIYDGASAAKIDLRAATLEAEIGGGGWLTTSKTLTGGFTIANGVSIEKATGGSGDDILVGSDRANRLDGAGGADHMIGGRGNDTYVSDGLDVIVEATRNGTDRVLTQASHRLSANVENLKLLGSDEIDGIGNTAANTITGNRAANMLTGGAGTDVLTGGGGEDTFLFRTRPGIGNTDYIRDFSTDSDVVALSAKVFTALGSGTLSSAAFKDISSGPIDADDRILYDRSTGTLSYDSDGDGATQALPFAIMDTKIAMSFNDILII